MTKKFKGNRPLKTILAACRKNHWPVNTDQYDNNGSDYVTFGFMHKLQPFDVVYNTFNGTFIVKVGGEYITERSTEMDGTPWYDALLKFIYTPLAKKKAA